MSILNFKEVGVQRMEDQASRTMMDLILMMVVIMALKGCKTK